jgi:hypothetical protein
MATTKTGGIGASIAERIRAMEGHAHNLLDECEALKEFIIGSDGGSDISFDDEGSNARESARSARRSGRIKADGSRDMRFKEAQEAAGQR